MKIAVWGLGRHAINNILPALKRLSDIELIGVFTREESIRNQCANNFDCKTWENHNEMLRDNDIDIVYLATPPALHYQYGIEVLLAGKHFWCEKPFTTNLDDTKHLIDLADKSNLTVAEGFMYLYHPQYLCIKEELQKYTLDEIKLINCTFTLPHTETPGFRYDPALGGSTLLDIGTYNISIVLELLEQQKPKILLSKSFIDESSQVDMSGFAVLQFRKGVICNLFWGMGFGYRNEIDILTTKGSLFSDKIFSKKEDFIPKIVVRNNNGEISYLECRPANHFILMFEHFKSLIKDPEIARIEKKRILNLATITEELNTR